MELVYLWVEDYKNIHNQGFNFHPRYECNYENPTLTICDKKEKNNECKNKNYIENLFADNISLTAIVGENGSGKTNLITFIIKTLFNQLKQSEYKNCIFIYKKENKLLIYSTYNELSINTSCIYQQVEKTRLQNNYHLIMSFAPGQIDIENQTDDTENTTYKQDYSVEPSRRYQSSGGAGIKGQIEPASFASTLIINAIPFYIHVNDSILESLKMPKFDTLIFKELSGIGQEVKMKNLENLLKVNFLGNNFTDAIQTIITDDILSLQSEIETYTIKSKKNPELKNKLELLKQQRTAFIKDLNDKLEQYLKNAYLISDMEKAEISDIETLNIYYRFIITNNNETLFTMLSTGQQVLIAYIGLIFRFMAKAQENQKQSFTVIIDEVETSLHPNWQAKFLDFLITNLKGLKPNFSFECINIILSSHSPFVISDIPKENIIFLSKFKKDDLEVTSDTQKAGNCKNVSDIANIEQTFGANIHTLLSHGFFMEDGLIGGFAKDKINDVIEYLNGNKSNIKTREEAEKIINIIGEPILKRQLEKMLMNKTYEINLIKSQIEALNKRLLEIENA